MILYDTMIEREILLFSFSHEMRGNQKGNNKRRKTHTDREANEMREKENPHCNFLKQLLALYIVWVLRAKIM